jgi:antagonist of KipI
LPTPIFHVEQPGLLSTVQDRGRVGWQGDGMVVAGAMDPFASQIANIVVGSGRGAAVLEITLRGPMLRALTEATVAVCGADLSAHCDGEALPLWQSVQVKRGQTLGFGPRRAGTRAYLAVAGGFDSPPVLGSRSTYLRGGMGGIDGRALQRGDVLSATGTGVGRPGRSLAPKETPQYGSPTVVCVLPGTHGGAFDGSAWETLMSAPYCVAPQSDRMGYRLTGPRLGYAPDFGGSILSEAVPWGGLQVPPDGQPILLTADRQTTGGYPLIGVAASVDLPGVAQAGPGDEIVFHPISLEDAQELAVAQERLLRLLELAAAAG